MFLSIAGIVLLTFGCSPSEPIPPVEEPLPRVESITIDGGRLRARISWSAVADRRVKMLHVAWNEGADSRIIDLDSAAATANSVIIESLDEGGHTFVFCTMDADGNRSTEFALPCQVYGENYQNGLINRSVTNFLLSGTRATIVFPKSYNHDIRYQQINYISSVTGEPKSVRFAVSQRQEQSFVIDDYGSEQFEYRTVFNPTENEFDEFLSSADTYRTPSKPLLLWPMDGVDGVQITPVLNWANPVTSGTISKVRICLSSDGISWQIFDGDAASETFALPQALEINSKYYWYVEVEESSGKVIASTPQSFTTSERRLWADREYFTIQEASAGAPRPVYLVITGDGFVREDFMHDGNFETAARLACEGLFALEPFKTYKNYFTVLAIAAWSKQRGMSHDVSESDKVSVDNVFGTCWTGGTHIDLGHGKSLGDGVSPTTLVDTYVRSIDKIPSDQKLCTIVIINEDRYAGTCWTIGYNTYALCPYSTSPTSTRDLTTLVCHEAGGHGYGYLADEYFSPATIMSSATASSLSKLIASGRKFNVSPVADRSMVHWAKYYSMAGYGRVAMYEGGYSYQFACFRAEDASMMKDNLWHYSAPAREAIVRRIMFDAGKTKSMMDPAFDFQSFVAKDVQRTPAARPIIGGIAAAPASVPSSIAQEEPLTDCLVEIGIEY